LISSFLLFLFFFSLSSLLFSSFSSCDDMKKLQFF
jgi:hypothetical protein